MTRAQPGQCGCDYSVRDRARQPSRTRPSRALDNPYELTASFPALAVSATS